MRLWDSASGDPLTPPLKHDGPISRAQFSADESRVLTWSSDGSARLWDSASGEPLTSPLEHDGPVSGAQFSADETRIVTWSQDGSARLRDSASGDPLTPPLKHDELGPGRPVQRRRVPRPHLEPGRQRAALGQCQRRPPDPAAQARRPS